MTWWQVKKPHQFTWLLLSYDFYGVLSIRAYEFKYHFTRFSSGQTWVKCKWGSNTHLCIFNVSVVKPKLLFPCSTPMDKVCQHTPEWWTVPGVFTKSFLLHSVGQGIGLGVLTFFFFFTVYSRIRGRNNMDHFPTRPIMRWSWVKNSSITWLTLGVVACSSVLGLRRSILL